MTILKKLWNDESGASAAEYALILAVVGSAIAFAAYALGTEITASLDNAADCIENPPQTDGGACTDSTVGGSD